MDINSVLLTTLQLLLTSGVGGVFIVEYATNGVFMREEAPVAEEHGFVSAYQELMWLAEKQRHRVSSEETRRFYQLRHDWSAMHV